MLTAMNTSALKSTKQSEQSRLAYLAGEKDEAAMSQRPHGEVSKRGRAAGRLGDGKTASVGAGEVGWGVAYCGRFEVVVLIILFDGSGAIILFSTSSFLLIFPSSSLHSLDVWNHAGNKMVSSIFHLFKMYTVQ